MVNDTLLYDGNDLVVSLETAVILHLAGFNQPTKHCFTTKAGIVIPLPTCKQCYEFTKDNQVSNVLTEDIFLKLCRLFGLEYDKEYDLWHFTDSPCYACYSPCFQFTYNPNDKNENMISMRMHEYESLIPATIETFVSLIKVF